MMYNLFDLLCGRSLVSRFYETTLKNGRKKIASLTRVAVNHSFKLQMYIWIALLWKNKPLIYKPLVTVNFQFQGAKLPQLWRLNSPN